METSIATPNDVRHIEVEGDNVMWSVDEPAKESPNVTVGTVYKLVTPQQLISIKVKNPTYCLGEIPFYYFKAHFFSIFEWPNGSVPRICPTHTPLVRSAVSESR